MLATLVHQPFDRRGWLFEIKWDGYRAIAEVDKGQVRLYSRNGLSFTKRYWPITAALQKLEHQAVLDGEVVVLDEKGTSELRGLAELPQPPSDRATRLPSVRSLAPGRPRPARTAA
jgi:bifunctional non-homologous end joining protein LigD